MTNAAPAKTRPICLRAREKLSGDGVDAYCSSFVGCVAAVCGELLLLKLPLNVFFSSLRIRV